MSCHRPAPEPTRWRFSARSPMNPIDNPTGASELRFAVAIHEAGHAIAFASVGIDVLSMWIGPEPNPSGRTQSGEIVAASRSDYLATIYAGDLAVDELCGGFPLSRGVGGPAGHEEPRGAGVELCISHDQRTRCHAR